MKENYSKNILPAEIICIFINNYLYILLRVSYIFYYDKLRNMNRVDSGAIYEQSNWKMFSRFF